MLLYPPPWFAELTVQSHQPKPKLRARTGQFLCSGSNFTNTQKLSLHHVHRGKKEGGGGCGDQKTKKEKEMEPPLEAALTLPFGI